MPVIEMRPGVKLLAAFVGWGGYAALEAVGRYFLLDFFAAPAGDGIRRNRETLSSGSPG